MAIDVTVCPEMGDPLPIAPASVGGAHEQLLIYSLCDFIREAIKERRAPVQNNRHGETMQLVPFDVKDGWAIHRQQSAQARPERPTIHVMPAMVETKQFNTITLQIEARTHSWDDDGYTYAFGVLIAIRDALFEVGRIDDRYVLEKDGTKLVMFDDIMPPIWCGGLHVNFTVPTRQEINRARY